MKRIGFFCIIFVSLFFMILGTTYDGFAQEPSTGTAETYNYNPENPPPDPPRPSGEPLVLDLSGKMEKITDESMDLEKLTKCTYNLQFPDSEEEGYEWATFDIRGFGNKEQVLFPYRGSDDKGVDSGHTALLCCYQEHQDNPNLPPNSITRPVKRLSDLFGNFETDNAFCQLKSLDENEDDLITEADSVFRNKHLFLWKDNGDGVYENSERKDLEEENITAFDVVNYVSLKDLDVKDEPNKNKVFALGSYIRSLPVGLPEIYIIDGADDLTVGKFTEPSETSAEDEAYYVLDKQTGEEQQVQFLDGSVSWTDVYREENNSAIIERVYIVDCMLKEDVTSNGDKQDTDNNPARNNVKVKGTFEGYAEIDVSDIPLIIDCTYQKIEKDKDEADNIITKPSDEVSLQLAKVIDKLKIKGTIEGEVTDGGTKFSITKVTSIEAKIDIRYPMWDVAFIMFPQKVDLEAAGTTVSNYRENSEEVLRDNLVGENLDEIGK